MHLVFATRGILHDVENFIKELSTRYLPFKRYNKKTKEMENKLIQMRVCPVQLWDVSFPEDHLDPVMKTVFSGGKGEPINPHINKFAYAARKAMKLKPLPDYDKKEHLLMNFPQNIEVIGIGIKEDKWITEDGKQVSKEDKTPNSTEGI